jgi:hypothetical protein
MPKLTDRFLATLSVDKDRLAFDTASPGLGVLVTAKGTRRFIVQRTGPITNARYASHLAFGVASIKPAKQPKFASGRSPRGSIRGRSGYGSGPTSRSWTGSGNRPPSICNRAAETALCGADFLAIGFGSAPRSERPIRVVPFLMRT